MLYQMDHYKGKRVTIKTITDGIFNGVVKQVDTQNKKIVLCQVKDCATGKYMKRDVHFFGDQIEDLRIHNNNEDFMTKDGSNKILHEDMVQVAANATISATVQNVILDSSETQPDLFQRKPLDPALYLSGYNYNYQSSLHKPPCGIVIDSMNKTFFDAIENIKSKKVVSLVAQGRQINRFGEISLIIIGAREMVYLFDVHTIGRDCFEKGIKDVLVDQNLLKVVHDVRMLSDCLHAVYDIKLINIFDTQVADAIIFKQSENTFPGVPSNLSRCVEKYCNEKFPYEQQILTLSKAKRDVYTKRPLDQEYANCCAKLGMYTRQLRSIMMQHLLAEFLCGVDIYLGCVRDLTDHAVRLLDPNKIPKEFSKIDYYKDTGRQNGRRRRLHQTPDDVENILPDTRTKVRSLWDAGCEFIEERQERHGNLVESMDGKVPLFDRSKPLLKSRRGLASESVGIVQASNLDCSSISTSPKNELENNKNMFTSSKYDIDPLRSLVDEMSLNQNYDEPTNSYNEFQMSASESRAILQNIHPNNNREEYSFDSLNDQEFPTIEDSQNLLDRHKKVRNNKKIVTTSPGMQEHSSLPQASQLMQSSPRRSRKSMVGRGKVLEMLVQQRSSSSTRSEHKNNNHCQVRFGETAQFDFPSDEELLQTPHIAPMHEHGPLAGEKVNIVKIPGYR